MSLTRDLARLHSDSDGNLILASNLTVDTNTLKVDGANNRVGIGTATPAAPLDIAGSNGVLAKLGATTELQIYADNNEISFRADADNDENDTIFTFDIDGSEKVRFDTPGHVGIGTTAPDANSFGAGHGILAVASDTGSQKTAMLNLIGDGNDTNNTRVASVFFNDASATGAGATLAGVEAYRASNHATDPGADLLFKTNMTGGSYTEKMRITAEGHVVKPLQPAFYAWTTNDGQSSGVYMTSAAGTTWGETFDQGNNFSGGVFTAPVAGKYYFSIMWNRNVVASRVTLRKNNNNYLRWEPTGRTDDTWESMHYSAMMEMSANDYANLYLEYNGTSSHPAHHGSGAWGHFAGYLVA